MTEMKEKIADPKKTTVTKRVTVVKQGEKKGAKAPSKQVNSVQGYIEAFEGSQLHGWVYDSANPDDSLEVHVYSDKQILARGSADISREDLLQANYGNGKHGFVIKLDDELLLASDEHQIKLALSDGKLVSVNDFTINLGDEMFLQGQPVASLRKSRAKAIIDELIRVSSGSVINSQDFKTLLSRLQLVLRDVDVHQAQLMGLVNELEQKGNIELARLVVDFMGAFDSKSIGKIIQLIDELERQDTKQSTSCYGAIELLEAGIIQGWAAEKNSDKPLTVNVVTESNRVIGQGKSCIYRTDLRQAGINAGEHGFKIDINQAWDTGQELELKLSLQNAETGQALLHPEFKQTIPSIRFFGALHRVSDGRIFVSINSKQVIGKQELILYHEDKIICREFFTTSSETIDLALPIPLRLMDGQRKLFKLGIAGYPNILAMQYFSVHPIQTPWQYLKESYNQPGFMSLPKQASFRYESLEYHLEALAKNKAVLSVNDLMTVHQVVVEGYEQRKKFPKFSLPKFAKPRVSIIVPAYNKFELSYHCIASIALAFNQTSYEVILADDCSDDETVAAENIITNLVISRNTENLRFLRNCNNASELAKGEFVVFLNNDTEVTSYWLDELVNKLDIDATIGMTGSKLLNLDGTLQEAGGIIWGNGEPWNVGRDANPLSPEYNYAREVDYLTGAAMCIRKDLWLQVDKFSDELIPCYYEDTDLAFKVRDAGYKAVYVPHSQVIHFEGKSHGTDVTKGLKRYQVVNEKTFRAKWFKAYKNYGQPSMENLALEKDRYSYYRVLVIDYATPMPNKDAGGYAAIQEIKLIQSLGFKVTFVPQNMAHFGKYSLELQRMGVEVLYAPFYTSVHEVLQQRLHEMDAVYITRYNIAEEYIDSIRSLSRAKIIFNNADLHFLREMRAALTNGRDESGVTQALKTRETELAVCRKADAVLCYNSTEHAVILSHILELEKFHITPWVLEKKSAGPGFVKREGIAFLGGYNHTPNVEAVEYLVKDVMPLLSKQRPDIHLSIYGSNMPEAFEKYASDTIKIVGFAESLDDVFHNHRVFVAPLLSGAGIKGKVLESMAYGLPTVLTEIAAEGTGLTHGISTLIAQNPEEWVDAIIELYDTRKTWERFAENEQLLVEAKYSFAHGHKQFKKIFASVGLYSAL